MHCYKKQQKVRIFGKGCGHMYKVEGEGVVADIFKGIMKAGKKLFQAYQDGNDVSNVSLTDDEVEQKQEGPMRIARKKKSKAETSV